MSTRRFHKLAACGMAVAFCALAGAGLPALADAPPSTTIAVPETWPRTFEVKDAKLQVYQPQVDSWQGNELRFRAAVAATREGSSEPTFGVIWATARTEVDPLTRQVTLADLRLTRSHFPTLADDGAAYEHELQAALPKGNRTIDLDRLEASLAANGKIETHSVKVDNKPPRIIVSHVPAVLIPIDGKPVIHKVPGTWFERVVNSQALIIRELGHKTLFLHLYDGWMTAETLNGPWTRTSALPPGADELAQNLAKSGKVDLLDGGPAKPSLDRGAPVVHVSETPTELVVFKGQPNFQPVGTTDLLWAANTTSYVLFDTGDNQFYMLISGRWFRAADAAGPLHYVPSNELPASFREIPTSSPAGVVLASVAGTPQAQEMAIANSVTRTADVPRSKGPAFTASYNGEPELRPIAGTPLHYVVNAPTPVIQVDAHTYYALKDGVWFVATSAEGPWVVATSVPEVIYTIPPSSPLHYVTYVKIYGSTPEVVYEGYTPGYLGTVEAPDGVVVYGTGYDYQPYVGSTVYYPPPVTYGVQAQPVYNPAVGWAYGAALGLTTAALVDSWNDNNNDHNNNYYYHDYYAPGYHGYPCCGSTSADVYGSWAHGATSGNETWSVDSSGKATEKYSGNYTNYATGTTGHVDRAAELQPLQWQPVREHEPHLQHARGHERRRAAQRHLQSGGRQVVLQRQRLGYRAGRRHRRGSAQRQLRCQDRHEHRARQRLGDRAGRRLTRGVRLAQL